MQTREKTRTSDVTQWLIILSSYLYDKASITPMHRWHRSLSVALIQDFLHLGLYVGEAKRVSPEDLIVVNRPRCVHVVTQEVEDNGDRQHVQSPTRDCCTITAVLRDHKTNFILPNYWAQASRHSVNKLLIMYAKPVSHWFLPAYYRP